MDQKIFEEVKGDSKMKISIIIPMFNAEKYIQKCLESIGTNLIEENKVEVILIDDGSTDTTKQICEDSIKKHQSNNIKMYYQENAGVSSARNYGISVATGEYLMFVDADDCLKSEWFSIVSESMQNNCDIYYYSTSLKQVSKQQMISYIVGNNKEHIMFAGPFAKIFKRSFIYQENITFKKGIINGEDMLFNLEALLKTDNFQIVSKSFYQYRIYIGSTTKKFDDRIVASDKEFQKSLNEILVNSNLEKEWQAKISNYCLYNAIFTIAYRIAFIQKFQKAREIFSFLKEEPYVNIEKKKDKLNDYSLKKKIVFFFIRQKQYYLVYWILRFAIQNSKTEKEYYINI